MAESGHCDRFRADCAPRSCGFKRNSEFPDVPAPAALNKGIRRINLKMKKIILIEIIVLFILLSINVYSQGLGHCPLGQYPLGHCENSSTNESQQPSNSSTITKKIQNTTNQENLNNTPINNTIIQVIQNIFNTTNNTVINNINQYKFKFVIGLSIFGVIELFSLVFLKTEIIIFIIRKIFRKKR